MSTTIYKGVANSTTPFTVNASGSTIIIIKSIYLEFTGSFSGTRTVEVTTQNDVIFFKRDLTNTDRVIMDDLHIPLVSTARVSTSLLTGLKIKTTATNGEGGLKATLHGVAYLNLSELGETNFAIPTTFMVSVVTTSTSAPVVPTNKNIVIKDIYIHNPHPSPGEAYVGIHTDSAITDASYFNTTVTANGTLILNNQKIPYATDNDRLKIFQQGSTNMTAIVTGWLNNNSVV